MKAVLIDSNKLVPCHRHAAKKIMGKTIEFIFLLKEGILLKPVGDDCYCSS